MSAHTEIERQKDEEFLERYERLVAPKLAHDHARTTTTDLDRTGPATPKVSGDSWTAGR